MSLNMLSVESSCQAALLAGLNANLYGMSQPLTALLFILEYGVGLDAPDEVKMTMVSGLEQCQRLSGMVRQMQKQVVASMSPE